MEQERENETYSTLATGPASEKTLASCSSDTSLLTHTTIQFSCKCEKWIRVGSSCRKLRLAFCAQRTEGRTCYGMFATGRAGQRSCTSMGDRIPTEDCLGGVGRHRLWMYDGFVVFCGEKERLRLRRGANLSPRNK